MMTLYDLTKKYGEGKSEDAMWKAVKIVSDSIETSMDDASKESLMKRIYGSMSDKHYNEELARADVSKMYYTDADGKKHFGPYWPEEAVQGIYDSYRDEIPDYNFWDFCVTMNMLASDNWCMLKRWFPNYNSSELNEKVAEMAVTWLSDEDWPTKTKIWDYLSSK